MLKLSRRAATDESIYLTDSDGNCIAKISIPEIRGRQVSICIQAKRDITITRNELLSESVQKTFDNSI